ncbi:MULTISPECIES: hypothetical protein [Acidiphilium]|nr:MULTISPECIES: hypothetical protein [Acidiphilium]
MDHAINAVFSIYCLLDWKEKTYKPDSKRRAYELCVESNNSALMMLHDIVSFTKHARVSSSLASTKIEVDSQNQDEQQIVTPDGRLIVTPDGVRIVVPARVLVKFGDMEAVTVLKHALSEFE